MKAEYVDHMGSDLSIVNAARVSFDKISSHVYVDEEGNEFEELVATGLRGPTTKADDQRLIRYLAKHDHWTPFAHTSITLRMKAPVPIRTQCFKHKQGLVENEESRRYISSRPELFVPEYFRCKPEGSMKQGSGGRHPLSDDWMLAYKVQCDEAISLYMLMLDDGICPEQARFILPQGVKVNWIWTGNLYAFANFYLKRTDAHAQKEIQQLAAMVGEVIAPLFPVSWKALTQQ